MPCTDACGQIFYVFSDRIRGSGNVKRRRVTFHNRVQYRTIPKREEPTMKEVLSERKLMITRARMPKIIKLLVAPMRRNGSEQESDEHAEERYVYMYT